MRRGRELDGAILNGAQVVRILEAFRCGLEEEPIGWTAVGVWTPSTAAQEVGSEGLRGWDCLKNQPVKRRRVETEEWVSPHT